MPKRAVFTNTWFISLLLALLTFALFAPSLSHGFLVYDDQEYVTENRHVLGGLRWAGIKWAFTTFYASNWHPLTWMSHMLDCQIWGLKPAGHHLTSVILHTLNTVLLFWVLLELTGGRNSKSETVSRAEGQAAEKYPLSTIHYPLSTIWPCAFVAALFAWHPLHVESVAWVAERKDVLSSFFFLLTIWAYAKYVASVREAKFETRNSKLETNSKSKIPNPAYGQHHVSCFTFHASIYYLLALAFFALALTSKPMVVTLPFVLLLLDYWPLRRFQLSTINHQPSTGSKLLTTDYGLLTLLVEKLPFFALSAAGCLLTLLAQGKAHAIVSKAGLPMGERVLHALTAYLHYLIATFVPVNLAVYYPYHPARVGTVVIAGVVLAGITVLAVCGRKQFPYVAVGWFWFLGTLVPVIGLVQVGDQAWADRYTYLPSIGLFIAAVWLAWRLSSAERGVRSAELSRLFRMAASAAAGCCVLCLLAVQTVRQLRYWKDTRTLFEHAAEVTPNDHLAITLLGSLLAQEGKVEQAVQNYQRALSIKPGYPEAHFYLGNALAQQGKTEEAIKEYRQVLWYKPVELQARILLGAALAKEKQYDEAVAQDRAALKLDPESAVAHNNLARALHTTGQLDEAIQHYEAALRYSPNLAEAHNNLGTLLLQMGKLKEGTQHLREALRLNAGNRETEYNLAVAFNQQEQWREAVPLFRAVMADLRADPAAHYQFGLALEHLQKTKEALSEFAAALLLQPDYPDALAALAWILSTANAPEFRNGQEAVRMAERANELSGGKDARKLKVLAAAYAETGRFSDAAARAEAARAVAAAVGNGKLADECKRMAEEFKAGRPWRSGDL